MDRAKLLEALNRVIVRGDIEPGPICEFMFQSGWVLIDRSGLRVTTEGKLAAMEWKVEDLLDRVLKLEVST